MTRTRLAVLAAGLWCLAIGAFPPGHAFAGEDPLQLPIGDPARRDRQAPLVLDGITDAATGEVITPAELARRTRDVGILFIGETHTSTGSHAVQLQTIQALHDAGRDVLIGLEMLPVAVQPALDGWLARRYTEAEFLAASDWYAHWGHHWNYYRDILAFARDAGLKLYAINSGRDVVRRVRSSGFEGLAPTEAALFPPSLAPGNEDHQRLYRVSFAAGDTVHLRPEALDGLYRAQTAWDATLGWNALQGLKNSRGGRKAIMVVLLGTGHVAYGLGAERQVDSWYDGRMASLIAVPVRDGKQRPVAQVRASYASFVWGIPAERDPAYPELGFSLMGRTGKEPRQVIQVLGQSLAEQAGVQVGDVLVSFDGLPVDADTRLRPVTARLRWGDVVVLGFQRNGELLELEVPLRRARH